MPRCGSFLKGAVDLHRVDRNEILTFGYVHRPMSDAVDNVNKEMKESQALAGFDYADFESSIAKFDSSFQVLHPFLRLVIFWLAAPERGQSAGAGACN